MATFMTLPAEIRNTIYEMSFAGAAKDSAAREMVELICCVCEDSERCTAFAEKERRDPKNAVSGLGRSSPPVQRNSHLQSEADDLTIQRCFGCAQYRKDKEVDLPDVKGAVAWLMVNKQTYSEAIGKHTSTPYDAYSDCS